MHPLIKKYLKAEIFRNTWSLIKVILVLVPVLSIIGMFSTAQNVPLFNQQVFLKNTNYDWIVFSEENRSDQSYGYFEANVANLVSDQGGIVYHDSYPIELFLQPLEIDTKNTLSYFDKKNLYSGDFSDLSADGESLDVAISYNVAEKLKVKIGDNSSLYFETDDGPVFFPITIKAIMLPKYMEKNDMFGGLVLAKYNKNFLNFLEENQLNYQTAMFGTDDVNIHDIDDINYKKDQLRAASLNFLSVPSLLIANLLFPIMGLLIIYMVFSREIKFEINRKMKMVGILLSLGISKTLIIRMFQVKYVTIILIAAIIAALIYKYLLFELYIREYIYPTFLGLILFIYVLIGISSIFFGMIKVKRIINDLSIHEIVTVKETS